MAVATLPDGYMIQTDSYDGSGIGDERFIPTLYIWTTRSVRRFLRKSTSCTGWFRVVLARDFQSADKQEAFLIDYANRIERSKA